MGFTRSLTAAALLAALLPVPALAAAQESAAVVPLSGEMRGAIAPGSFWRDLDGRTPLQAGDSVKSGKGANAELILGSGGRMTLAENTLVRMQEAPEGLEARVMVGRIRLTAPPRGKSSVLVGDFRVAGTDADAILQKVDGEWQVAVLAGRLEAQQGDGAPTEIEAGSLVKLGSRQTTTLSRTAMEDLQVGFPSAPARKAPVAKAPKAPKTSKKVRPGKAPLPEEAAEPRPADGAAGTGMNRYGAAMLSILVPGAGQISTGETTRGMIYMGLDFALLGAGFYAKSIGQGQIASGAMLGLLGLNLVSPLDAFFTTREAARQEENVELAPADKPTTRLSF